MEADRRCFQEGISECYRPLTRRPSSVWGVIGGMPSQDGEGGGKERKKKKEQEGGMV